MKPKWWQLFLGGVALALLGLCVIFVGAVGLGVADEIASVGAPQRFADASGVCVAGYRRGHGDLSGR